MLYNEKVLNFVKDYWDVGAAIAAGLAFNDYGNEIFGDYRWPIFLGGALSTLNGFEKNPGRYERNVFIGTASFYYFWSKGIEDNISEVASKLNNILSVGFTTIGIIADLTRKEIKTKPNLENLI